MQVTVLYIYIQSIHVPHKQTKFDQIPEKLSHKQNSCGTKISLPNTNNFYLIHLLILCTTTV